MDTRVNKLAIAIIGFFMCISSIALAQNITNAEDSLSYSLGVVFAKEMKKQGVQKINSAIAARAIEDYFNSADSTLISTAESEQLMRTYLKTIKQQQMLKAKEEGEKFLAENAKKEGITVTPSGLQYEVLVKGEGTEKPTLSSKVNTHYHGMLIDGRVFDSSVERGEPISFPLNAVITGWQEGLQLMSVGDKFRFYIPSELAYGGRGAGALIAPHSALIFEVELLGIQ